MIKKTTFLNSSIEIGFLLNQIRWEELKSGYKYGSKIWLKRDSNLIKSDLDFQVDSIT